MKTLLSYLLLSLSLTSFSFASDIEFSSGISKKHIKLLKHDLNLLNTLNFSELASPSFKTIYASDTFSADIISSWLDERIQFIVEEGFSQKFIDQINPEDILGPFTNGISTEVAAVNNSQQVVMNNVGSIFYMIGKKLDVIFGIKVETEFGDRRVPVSSPRSGIVEIGKGLFRNAFSNGKKSFANSTNRLGVLLHEARHSDGNSKAKSLAFVHTVCPEGHDLKGLVACDKTSNGAYSAGATFYNELSNKCDQNNCSESDKAFLKAQAFDAYSRVTTLEDNNLDDKPEGTRIENQ